MINAAKPDILWVGLGSPKQDIWMHEHRDKLDVSVMHGVGAAFDFLSGELPQAPRWMMNSGLEWLFRLMVEPRRLWKRYTVVNLKFLYLVARELFGG
jgi:N-acetylglucosaminyldiphosphoundecaprenol N-acetyl-beta-D-mannosaminyltransferase